MLDEFNAAYPWDHNAYYHRWILRQLPPRFGRALDAGSGSGDLARLLAGRADRVCGIDIDPVISDGVVSVWRRGSRLPGGAAGVRGRGGLVWRW